MRLILVGIGSFLFITISIYFLAQGKNRSGINWIIVLFILAFVMISWNNPNPEFIFYPNRNPHYYEIIMVVFGISWQLSLIVLLFSSYLCPKCKVKLKNKEWKEKFCPKCGNFMEV